MEAASAFAAPIAALLLGEVLTWRSSELLTVQIIKYLQKRVPAKLLDLTFPAWLKGKIEAYVAVVTGIPCLYLTLIAFYDVPRIGKRIDGWIGYAVAVVGSLLLLAYGWSVFPDKVIELRIWRLSLPAFTLFVFNAIGLIIIVS